MPIKYSIKGFSLVEMLVYIALMIVVMVVSLSFILSIREPLLTYQAHQILQHDASIIFARMTNDIRNAVSVNNSASTFGMHPGKLVVEDALQKFEYELNGSSSLEYSVDDVLVGRMTSDVVTVDDLQFTRMTSSTTEAVRVDMTLSATKRGVTKSATFYTSVVLRGAYD